MHTKRFSCRCSRVHSNGVCLRKCTWRHTWTVGLGCLLSVQRYKTSNIVFYTFKNYELFDVELGTGTQFQKMCASQTPTWMSITQNELKSWLKYLLKYIVPPVIRNITTKGDPMDHWFMRRPFCKQSSIAEKALISVCAVGFIIASYLTLLWYFQAESGCWSWKFPTKTSC